DGPGPFDERYGLTGGEDTQLFERLRRSGAELRWSEEAVVYETVPASRVDRRWLVRRQYRRGLTLSAVLVELGAPRWRIVKRLGAAATAMAQGVWQAARGVVGRDEVQRLAGLQRTAFGLGELVGLFGLRYEEYRTVHGA